MYVQLNVTFLSLPGHIHTSLQENIQKLFKQVIQFNPEVLQAGGGSGLGLFSKFVITKYNILHLPNDRTHNALLSPVVNV